MATFAMREAAGLKGTDIDPQTLQDNAQQWIVDVMGSDVFSGTASFGDALGNGQILCDLINRLQKLLKDSAARLGDRCKDHTGEDIVVKKVYRTEKPFQRMENITHFLLACRKYGVRDEELFTTADLFHKREQRNVVAAIHALARRIQLIDAWVGPQMGEEWDPNAVADLEPVEEPEPIEEPAEEEGKDEDFDVRARIEGFNIGHVTVHDSVINDFKVLKARRQNSWMMLVINEEEHVVFVEDSMGGASSSDDCAASLVKVLPTASCRYAIVDLREGISSKLYFLSWIPAQSQGHIKMMYSSQIGTVTSYGGSGFTAFRGLHEIKTVSPSQVRAALLGDKKAGGGGGAAGGGGGGGGGGAAGGAGGAVRRTFGTPTTKKAKPKSTAPAMASGRKADDDSSDESDFDPCA